MGKILGIRVQAQTYNEDDVAETWPRLCALVWPLWVSRLAPGNASRGIHGPVREPGPVEKSLGGRKHGVLELAQAIPELVKFGSCPKDITDMLTLPAEKLKEISVSLETALGNLDAREALGLTDRLEDVLNTAEQAIAKN